MIWANLGDIKWNILLMFLKNSLNLLQVLLFLIRIKIMRSES